MNEEIFIKYIDSSDALFHYTKINTLLLIISNMEIKFSKLSETNDPYEYKKILYKYPAFFIDNPDEKINSIKIREVENKLDELIKERSKFISFCNNSKTISDGYKKSRMWSQYGESHKGGCIVLSKDLLEKYTKEKYNKQIFFNISDIVYKDSLKIPDDFKRLTTKLIDNDKEIYQKLVDANDIFFYSKLKDYEKEDESRLLVIENNNDEILYLDISDIIKGVILGDKYDRKYKNILKEYSNKCNFPIIKNYFDTNEGKFKICSIY